VNGVMRQEGLGWESEGFTLEKASAALIKTGSADFIMAHTMPNTWQHSYLLLTKPLTRAAGLYMFFSAQGYFSAFSSTASVSTEESP